MSYVHLTSIALLGRGKRPTYAPREEAGGLGRRKAEVQAMATKSRAAKRPDAVLKEEEGMVTRAWL